MREMRWDSTTCYYIIMMILAGRESRKQCKERCTSGIIYGERSYYVGGAGAPFFFTQTFDGWIQYTCNWDTNGERHRREMQSTKYEKNVGHNLGNLVGDS